MPIKASRTMTAVKRPLYQQAENTGKHRSHDGGEIQVETWSTMLHIFCLKPAVALHTDMVHALRDHAARAIQQ